jgi:hypothetical protein
VGPLEVDHAYRPGRDAVGDDVVVGEVAVDDQPPGRRMAEAIEVGGQPRADLAHRRLAVCADLAAGEVGDQFPHQAVRDRPRPAAKRRKRPRRAKPAPGEGGRPGAGQVGRPLALVSAASGSVAGSARHGVRH